MKLVKTHRTFDGVTQFWKHASRLTKTEMGFSTYLPDGEIKGCLIWLSGLTCTEENFVAKAGAQRFLAEEGLMVICPDTSPRGLQLKDETASWDFGQGAGFYVDATTDGYRDHYLMYSYVLEEVTALARENFIKAGQPISIFGHSMGGHGALVLGLRNPEKFASISALSPIVNPTAVPWGKKAFTGYLGDDHEQWLAYDACELLKSGARHGHAILVDQGTDDQFLEVQLKTDNLVVASKNGGQELEVRMQKGFDHSYYFISSFVEDHVRFHADAIAKKLSSS